ncbi:MAG: RHS repeat-associated core domain-containing protein, partial [Pirellulales bacterium]|nr:RHS repeat-associated core domain-containing protein [Pirellulales bacterium]
RDIASERLYAMQDRQYKVIALSDISGNVVERYSYTPYGESTIYDSSFTIRSNSSYNWVFLFTGRRLDEESSLYYFRNRYYHKKLGRFCSRDPIGYVGGINLYQFLSSSPLGFMDSSGMQVEPPQPLPPPEEEHVVDEEINPNHWTPTGVPNEVGPPGITILFRRSVCGIKILGTKVKDRSLTRGTSSVDIAIPLPGGQGIPLSIGTEAVFDFTHVVEGPITEVHPTLKCRFKGPCGETEKVDVTRKAATIHVYRNYRFTTNTGIGSFTWNRTDLLRSVALASHWDITCQCNAPEGMKHIGTEHATDTEDSSK